MPWWRWNVSTTWSPSPRAHQSGVHEHARQLRTDRPMHERRRHRRINPTGQRADDAALPHLLADRSDGKLDHRAHRPRRLTPAHVVQEVLEHGLAVRRVHHFGMELHCVHAPLDVFHGGHRRVDGGRRHPEPVGRRADRVEVAHPHLLMRWLTTSEQHAWRHDVEIGPAVLPSPGPGHHPAELLSDQLRSVADAEQGTSRSYTPMSTTGAPSTYTDAGPPLKITPAGSAAASSLGGDRVGHDLAVDVGLAHARAMSCAYWAPKSTTRTGPVGVLGVSAPSPSPGDGLQAECRSVAVAGATIELGLLQLLEGLVAAHGHRAAQRADRGCSGRRSCAPGRAASPRACRPAARPRGRCAAAWHGRWRSPSASLDPAHRAPQPAALRSSPRRRRSTSALAMSPPVTMPPSAMTWTYTPVSSRWRMRATTSVGDRGGLGDTDTEHRASGRCLARPDADQHARRAGPHEVQRSLVAEHPPTMTGMSSLRTKRLRLSGSDWLVTCSADTTVPWMTSRSSSASSSCSRERRNPLRRHRRARHDPAGPQLLDPGTDQFRLDRLGVDLLDPPRRPVGGQLGDLGQDRLRIVVAGPDALRG